LSEVRFLVRRCGESYMVKELRQEPHWWSRSTWEYAGSFDSLAKAEAEVKRRADPREEVRWYNANGEIDYSW
jgi:hypothetical protein